MAAATQVLHMLDLWKALDLDGAIDCFADDAMFIESPGHEPAVGKAAIRAVFDGYLTQFDGYDYEVRTLAGDDRVAMMERFDIFRFPGGKTMRLPLTGVFEVDGAGKIAHWRDYWDRSTVPGVV